MTDPVADPPEKRLLPSLPNRDPRLGEIRWSRWEPVVQILCRGTRSRSSVDLRDGSCSTCSHPGPLVQSVGSTWYTPPPLRRITRRSNVAAGVRPESEPARAEPYWCHSHFAVRCPACDETFVYLLGGFSESGEFTELEAFYVPPREQGMLF
ncbi:hypothetical protein ACFU0X_34810 [Streptomyces cellulosae]|uniref:CULT domain-containing protein n=1 Tax=Streptomyces cellulosae TaxID=1968 RepID=A0ABW6JU07_STRCE